MGFLVGHERVPAHSRLVYGHHFSDIDPDFQGWNLIRAINLVKELES